MDMVITAIGVLGLGLMVLSFIAAVFVLPSLKPPIETPNKEKI